MKVKDLQWKRALRTALLVLLLNVVGFGKVYGDVLIGDFYYDLHDNTLTAEVNRHKDGTNASGPLVIPSYVTYTNSDGVTRTYTVTTIDGYSYYNSAWVYTWKGAFEDCSGLTGNLIIPNTVTTINTQAFMGCSGFSGDLTIPNSVTSIGNYAFYGCSGFTGDLTISNSVSTIGMHTFDCCSGFTGSLTIGNSVTTIGTFAFRNCSGFTGSLTIPNTVTSIGQYAFDGCSGFTGNLTIGNSVTTIDDYAFRNCSGFTGSLIIPDFVTSISSYAFQNCSGFTGNLTIGNSVATIGYGAFQNCSGFTGSLTISNSVTTIGISAFQDCNGFIGDLTIGNSVTSIGGWAFYNCSGFTEVHYNATNCANTSSNCPPFSGCGGTLTIGDNVERIPSYMFKNGAFTGNLTISDSVTSIGTDAFYDCNGFTGDLTIGTSVTSIGSSAFHGCSGFSGDLIIGTSVTSIGSSAFYGCSGFSGSLTIPNSVTTISGSAFYGCSSLTELTIGEGVTTIGSLAFWNCPALVTVHFNATNCTQMRSYSNGGVYSSVFSSNGNVSATPIVTLTIGDNVTKIPGYAFEFSPNITALTIPSSVTTIGGNAFSNCRGLTSLTIGNSVTTIGNYSFSNCKGLTSMTVLAETPPAIQAQTFYNVPKSIPVYVPCGSTGVYQSTAYWSQFTNIQESSYEISVEVNPSEGGLVTGAGTYCAESNCTLIAVANIGYLFTNWTENGMVVSTDTLYSFTILSNRILVANFSYIGTSGMLDGMFSVSNSKKVCFSQGNLQYQASTDTWRFADHQWDYVGGMVMGEHNGNVSGSSNSSISPTYDGWIDLFGWGTSGWDNGNTCYHPWDINSDNDGTLFGPPSLNSLVGEYANADWGVYNPISNGGNQANQWRTLTYWEWNYLFNTRATSSGVRYAKAQLNGVNGLILVPDNWDASVYELQNINTSESPFDSNLIDLNVWINTFESNGAVFLPAAGARFYGTTLFYLNDRGYYWSSTCHGNLDDYASNWGFSDEWLNHFAGNRSTGCSVRLVRDVVTQTVNLSQGWNWWSTNLDITLDDLKTALMEAVPGTNITIKSRAQNIAYNPGTNQWRGTLDSLDVTQMYMISVSADCEISLTGMPINPADYPITIYSGVNWIAFPLSENMSVSDAFAGFAMDGDIIKSRTNNASYNNGEWRGNLNTLVPGQGYMYKSTATESRTFTFPSAK